MVRPFKLSSLAAYMEKLYVFQNGLLAPELVSFLLELQMHTIRAG